MVILLFENAHQAESTPDEGTSKLLGVGSTTALKLFGYKYKPQQLLEISIH